MLRTEIDEHTTTIANMKRDSRPVLAQLGERPTLTPFFVGREEELAKLEHIMVTHGSAAIMQYGGVEKRSWQLHLPNRLRTRSWFQVDHIGS